MSLSSIVRMAVCATALCLTGAARADTNLIVNGSFEADPQAAGGASFHANLKGWIGGTYDIELRNNCEGTAFDGNNYVELDTYRNSSMSQLINTAAGQAYTLSFAYSPRRGVGEGSNGIKVQWNGVDIATETASGWGNNDNVWAVHYVTVVGAEDGPSILTFKAIGADDGLGGSLDAVALAPVPEPSTYAMMLIGAGLVGFTARRQRNGKFSA